MWLWRRLFDRINILQTFISKPSTTKQLRCGCSKGALSLLFYFVSLTCCSITMTTNSPMKHRKKPGAIPCHSATKASVKKCERSLFPRKRSLLYKYLVVKIRWQYQFLEILESCSDHQANSFYKNIHYQAKGWRELRKWTVNIRFSELTIEEKDGDQEER